MEKYFSFFSQSVYILRYNDLVHRNGIKYRSILVQMSLNKTDFIIGICFDGHIAFCNLKLIHTSHRIERIFLFPADISQFKIVWEIENKKKKNILNHTYISQLFILIPYTTGVYLSSPFPCVVTEWKTHQMFA